MKKTKQFAIRQTLGQFNLSDWQIMHWLSWWCWANVCPIYYTHLGSMLFQCWAGLLVTLGQRWPNVAHNGPTLVQCWTKVMRKLAIHWVNVGPTRWDNIGPMSRITLGQRHLPTLAQCNWLHWPNVGPTLACYLGLLIVKNRVHYDSRCVYRRLLKIVRHQTVHVTITWQMHTSNNLSSVVFIVNVISMAAPRKVVNQLLSTYPD